MQVTAIIAQTLETEAMRIVNNQIITAAATTTATQIIQIAIMEAHCIIRVEDVYNFSKVILIKLWILIEI